MAGAAAFERGQRAGESILVVHGEIDLAAADDFRDELRTLIGEANSPALVDLSGVTFMDSSGVDALASARRRADDADVELILVEPSSPVRMVLEVAGLWTHFQVRPAGF
ncbi:MAG: STAS domain-containing protein [Acidimicrobiia bacterium]